MKDEHDFGEPFSSLNFGGDEFGYPINLECDGFDSAYIPNNNDQSHQISLFDDIMFDVHTPTNVQEQNNIFSDNLINNMFGVQETPVKVEQEASNEFSSFIPSPTKTLPTEQPGGIVLSQSLIDQIMNNDNTLVLEMLREKIRTSAVQPVPFPQQLQQQEIKFVKPELPPVVEAPRVQEPLELKTESIQAEKPAPKKGIKKRRYVKSGLFRKDKSGNFIYSSSDRARMSQPSEVVTDEHQPQTEQPASSADSSRVKRPLNGYNIFCKTHFDQVKLENPTLSINELSKLMGERWKSMDTEQKQTYYDKVQVGQTRYKKPLNSYNLFCKMNFEALKKEFPQKSIHVLSKVIAERWKKLSNNEKKKYYEEAERQKQASQIAQLQQSQQQQQQVACEQQQLTSTDIIANMITNEDQSSGQYDHFDAFSVADGFSFDIYNHL
ncbi:high mobility group protein [Acrasis kona]|uniref:High mobility group protein n=1 Tax=Acrasis kona TaxID=1008807 RepID=A0AAW2Z405_9EUKA